MATKKKAKKKSVKRLASADLRAATLASVKAALGRAPGGGIINGFVLDEAVLAKLGVSAKTLAKEVTVGTSRATGLKLKPLVIERPGTILVGFAPPSQLPSS